VGCQLFSGRTPSNIALLPDWLRSTPPADVLTPARPLGSGAHVVAGGALLTLRWCARAQVRLIATGVGFILR